MFWLLFSRIQASAVDMMLVLAPLAQIFYFGFALDSRLPLQNLFCCLNKLIQCPNQK